MQKLVWVKLSVEAYVREQYHRPDASASGARSSLRRKSRSRATVWHELIKKVWQVDPLICPHCGSEMKLIALIDDDEVIAKILRHLKLWPGHNHTELAIRLVCHLSQEFHQALIGNLAKLLE